MKIYNLTIAYKDDTEEIEYIQETIENDSGTMSDDLLSDLIKEGFKDSLSIAYIEELEDIAEA